MYVIKFIFKPEDGRLPMYLMKDGGFCAVHETGSTFTDDYIRKHLRIFMSHTAAEDWLMKWDKDLVLDPYLRDGDVASIVHFNNRCERVPVTGFSYNNTDKRFHRLLFQQPPHGSPGRLDAVPMPATIPQPAA